MTSGACAVNGSCRIYISRIRLQIPLIHGPVFTLNVSVLLFYCVAFILLDWLILAGKEKKRKSIK